MKSARWKGQLKTNPDPKQQMKSESIRLTQEILNAYLEGQIEILSNRGKTLYHGKIQTITLESDGSITVTLYWIAKGESHKLPGRWVMEADHSTCTIGKNHSAVNTGSSIHGGSDRIAINTGIDDYKIFTLFPPDGRLVDPERIQSPN